jgi:hypothetical protein
METYEELLKEVFAQFGDAYYHSEVLHKELCNYYALTTFDKKEDATLPRIEERFVVSFSMTLGQIVEKTKELFPSDLKQRLEEAVEKRNYLAHHFWYERSPKLYSGQGLIELRQELLNITDIFSELDKAIIEYSEPKRKTMGVTDELLQVSLNKLIAGEPDEPFITKRLIKKHEHIVKAWNVKLENDLATLIFETEDGCLWQLCDIGLGWTKFDKPTVDWIINENIQKYLPNIIDPRPTIIMPWNYEFNFGNGVVFCVKRGNREKSYSWGIKKKTKS